MVLQKNALGSAGTSLVGVVGIIQQRRTFGVQSFQTTGIRDDQIRWVEINSTMKTRFITAAVLLSVTGAAAAVTSLTARQSFANSSPIPNLVGTWKVQAEGAVVLHGENYSVKSHHAGKFTSLNAEAVIQKQVGRRVIGIFKSPRYTEKFAGVISVDGKTFAYVDEDGSLDGKIINKNLIEVVYRHINSAESVVSSGTYEKIR